MLRASASRARAGANYEPYIIKVKPYIFARVYTRVWRRVTYARARVCRGEKLFNKRRATRCIVTRIGINLSPEATVSIDEIARTYAIVIYNLRSVRHAEITARKDRF